MRNASKAGLVLLAVAAAFLAGSLEFRRAAADTFGFGGGASSGTVAISNAVRVYVDGGTIPVSGTVAVSGYVATVVQLQDGGVTGVATEDRQITAIGNQAVELSYLDGGTKNLASINTYLSQIAPCALWEPITPSDSQQGRHYISVTAGTGGNERLGVVIALPDGGSVVNSQWFVLGDSQPFPYQVDYVYASADAGNPATNLSGCY